MFSNTIKVLLDVVFLLVAVLLLLPKNPSLDEATPSPGNVTVEIRWEDNVDTDIDLWVRGPDGVSVGYSNRQSTVFNLLRDDLGTIGDLGGLNYEFAYSRGTPAGEYIVNVHNYREGYGRDYTEVLVRVTVVYEGERRTILRVHDAPLTLSQREERTAVRFTLDGDGMIVPNSIHNTQEFLRNRSESP